MSNDSQVDNIGLHTLIQDDSSAADAARQRLTPKSSFPRFLSNLSSKSKRNKPENKPKQSQESDFSTDQAHQNGSTYIRLDNSELDHEEQYKDLYDWAVLYENQRGITMFSIPYYSSLSLLPNDPLPFTLPNTSAKRSEQSTITLSNYPLPDGNWRWVSRSWMIDMRSDYGEVQHDGFEYNWSFRQHHWRSRVGAFSAGGWVRRRRWVRLMVRPANQKKPFSEQDGQRTPTTISTVNGLIPSRNRLSLNSSYPSSFVSTKLGSSIEWSDITSTIVWLGNDPDANWKRVRKVMRICERDGWRLEIWKIWLGYYNPDFRDRFTELDKKGKRREKQWTEDDVPMPSEIPSQDSLGHEAIPPPPREYIAPILRNQGQMLLHSFIFPESRAQFLKLLALSGLLPELNVALGIGYGASEIDFWSYASGLGDQLGLSTVPTSIANPAPSPESILTNSS